MLGVREAPYPNLDVIALLLERGADPNARGYFCHETVHGGPYKSSTTVLHSAIDSNLAPSVIELLLEHGADPNLPNGRRLPLHEVAVDGNPAIVELLLKYGADPNTQDREGNTPLLIAVERPSRQTVDIVAILIDYGADPNMRIVGGKTTPLYVAVDKNLDTEVIEMLLDRDADIYAVSRNSLGPGLEDETALHAAARNPNQRVLSFLLERGVDINAAYLGHRIEGPYADQTPLHSAALRNPNPDVIMLMLDHGADIEAKDLEGRTPLHWAARNSTPQALALLLDHGSDVDKRDRQGWTPLHWAIREQNHTTVGLLLRRGADPNSVSNVGSTPLHSAAKYFAEPHIIKLLIDHGADIDARNGEGNDPCKIS